MRRVKSSYKPRRVIAGIALTVCISLYSIILFCLGVSYAETINSNQNDIYSMPSPTAVEDGDISEKIQEILPVIDTEKIRQEALISAIGTENEQLVWGFNVSDLIRIIANEGGDFYDVCWDVTTCVYNTQVKYDFKLTPDEVCYKYKYDIRNLNKSALSYENARKAVIEVFVYGNTDSRVGDSTVFCTSDCYSPYHESQIFCAEIHGIRYFIER